MGLTATLKKARELGFPESDIQRLTDAFQKSNQLNAQLKSTAHTPKNLFEKEKDQKTFSGYADLKKSEKKANKDIKQLKKDITSNTRAITGYKKDYRAAFWIDDPKKRRSTRKELKSKIRQTRASNKEKQEKIESLKEHLEDIAHTKGVIEGRAQAAKTEYETLAAIVNNYSHSKKSILAIQKTFTPYLNAYLSKKADINNPKSNPMSPDFKYKPILDFFKSLNNPPSLANPLPKLTPELEALMKDVINQFTKEEIMNIKENIKQQEQQRRAEKYKKQAEKIQEFHNKFNKSKDKTIIVFTGVAQALLQHFTAPKGTLAKASSVVLDKPVQLPPGHTPLLLSAGKGKEDDNVR